MANKYEKYEHHGAIVFVRSDLKGKHRDYCQCFDGCIHFKPGTPDNCEIAQGHYEVCVKFNTTTPMFECPKFEQ